MPKPNSLPREAGLLWPAFAWLAFLGPWFFLAYGFCNWFTEYHQHPQQFFWAWERSLPFVPALVVPYMSLDLFYAGAPFLCRSRQELHLLGKRLFTATTLSCLGFLAYPLEYGWARPQPASESWTAPIFQFLHLGDKPYNQCPSLHISLRCLLWMTYGRHLLGGLRKATKTWFILIGLSTLLVGQHHFIDIVGGFLMAYLVVMIWPDHSQPVVIDHPTPQSRKLAKRYGLGALGCAIIASAGSGWLWFGWPAVALGLIAMAYATRNPRWWQRSAGTLTPAVEWIMLPVIVITKLYQARWRKGPPRWHEITPGVFFGRRPTQADAAELDQRSISAVLDLTAEATLPPCLREQRMWLNLPTLDLVPPSAEVIQQAVEFISAHEQARVLIFCELGLGRSARVALAWLRHRHPELSPSEAASKLLTLEPRAVLP